MLLFFLTVTYVSIIAYVSSMAFEIIRLIKNPDKAIYYSQNGRQDAIIRHDPKRIVSKLMSIYENIVE